MLARVYTCQNAPLEITCSSNGYYTASREYCPLLGKQESKA